MPRLPDSIQSAAEEAEVRDYQALKPGTYELEVAEIDTTATSNAGNDMWVWEFDVIDEDYQGRKLWDRTALTEAAAWKIKQVFDALGFTLDSDADELVGERLLAVVVQEEIPSGKRKGQMGNVIDTYMSLDAGDDGDEAEPEEKPARKTAAKKTAAKKSSRRSERDFD